MITTEKTARQQARSDKGGFQPGQSGNPSGRPLGSRNKATIAVESLIEGEAEKLARVCIERALAGDMVALKICIDRLAPPRRDRPTPFPLPKLKEAADARDAFASVVKAVSEGELTPAEGGAVAGLIEQFADVDRDTNDARYNRERKLRGGRIGLDW